MGGLQFNNSLNLAASNQFKCKQKNKTKKKNKNLVDLQYITIKSVLGVMNLFKV